MYDGNKITRALQAYFSPGDVFEVRILEAITAGFRRKHIESGYFDYEHIDEVSRALRMISAYKGIYVTANPCKPELLARAAYKLSDARDHPTTTDKDILKRQWLLVDCDAQRASGISSSDQEHQAALAKASQIKRSLAEDMGWPQPIWVDSGNGSQLMYRVDLPTDDNRLVQMVLNALAMADNEQVKIDISVYNPARIWRLPGTMNCKGDSIPTRPHRMAHILEIPETLEEVPRQKLEEVAGYNADGQGEPPVFFRAPGEFNLDQWIARYCHDISNPQPYQGGRKWVFSVCPFCPEHNDRSAVIIQRADGQIGFKCHHSSCSGNNWHALRLLLDADFRSRQDTIDVNAETIDIRGILATGKRGEPPRGEIDDEEAPIENIDQDSDTIPFPEKLYEIPGLVGDVMKTTLKYASKSNRPLALAGALTLMSYLAARKIKSPSGLRPNIYILALAHSGCGKECPRDINQMILEAIGMDNGLIDDIASGEGLEDALLVNPALFWQCDEFYSTLHNMAIDNNQNKNTLMKYLLKLYTNSHKNMRARNKAGKPQGIISCPHLTLLATTTPHAFFKHLDDRFLIDGMYSRLNILMAEQPTHGKLIGEPVIAPELIERAMKWRDFRPFEPGNIENAILAVPYTPLGQKRAEEMLDAQNKEYDALLAAGEEAEWKFSIWNRACEIGLRYALIYAASVADEPERTQIDEKAIAWGRAFSWWEIKNKIHMTTRNFFESGFEAQAEFVIRVMQKWHKTYGDMAMPGWQFNRKTKKIEPRLMTQVLESLTNQKRLMIDSTKSGGHVYWLPGSKKINNGARK